MIRPAPPPTWKDTPMDPDATWAELLDEAAACHAGNGDPAALAAKVLDLDGWLARGGHLPQAWRSGAQRERRRWNARYADLMVRQASRGGGVDVAALLIALSRHLELGGGLPNRWMPHGERTAEPYSPVYVYQ